MKLTSEAEAEGLRAYEQAAAFERLRRWRLPLAYGVFPLLPVISGVVLLEAGHVTMATLQFVAAVAFSFGLWRHWRALKARYAKNLELLADLKSKYGDGLPWLQVERHFAELERLERDLAEEKGRG